MSNKAIERKSQTNNEILSDIEQEYETKQQWLREQMRLKIPEFTRPSKLSVFCGTWNVNDKTFPITEDNNNNIKIPAKLKEWLLPDDTILADLYAIGFQEAVDLNTLNVVLSNQKINERLQYWKELVEECLTLPNQQSEYTLLIERHLVGLLLFVYVKKSLLPNIRDVRSTLIPTGVLSIMGNKGGVCIRFDFQLSSICFICSHFHAGREATVIRNNDFKIILEKTIFPAIIEANSQKMTHNQIYNHSHNKENISKWWYDDVNKNKTYNLFDHDHIFWFGDLNYRIEESIQTEDIFNAVNNKDTNELWLNLRKNDQLVIEKNKGIIFNEFKEGEIKFPPSYKYQPGTNLYDFRLDKKLRAPAWCDRILYRHSPKYPDSITMLLYKDSNIYISDHKPILGLYSCDIRISLIDKEREIYQGLLSILDRWENSNTPKLELIDKNLDFGVLNYNIDRCMNIRLKNIGGVFAQWSFVPKLEDEFVCLGWLKLSPQNGILAPGESTDIIVRISPDSETINQLRDDLNMRLDDIVVLRVTRGSDFFITVSASIDRSTLPSRITANDIDKVGVIPRDEDSIYLGDIYGRSEGIYDFTEK